MRSGIYTVAYGADYDRCAAHAFRYSRKHTALPFAVATNLRPAERSKTWAEVENVRFVYHDRPQRANRRPKLNMDLLSPWDRTLYLDADCVIQKSGVEVFEKILDSADLVFNWRVAFRPGDRIWNIYARTMAQFGVTKPINIYNGAMVAFKKTAAARSLFAEWLRMWEATGQGREMPSLCCAIKKTRVTVGTFPLLYFADAHKHLGAIVQHDYEGFNEAFGIPAWTEYKPFDQCRANDDFRHEVAPS